MKNCFKRINNKAQLNANILTLKRTIFDSHITTNQSVATIKEGMILFYSFLFLQIFIFLVRDGLKKLVGFSAVYSKTDADKTLLDSYKITNQSELATSRMSKSYDEAIIPIGISFKL
jgi:hypothetical protein